MTDIDRQMWRPCELNADGGMNLPHVHDNFVYAVAAHLERRVLVLHTEYRDGPGPSELTDVRFVGLVAYHFDDVIASSILFSIERVGAAFVVKHWGELFETRKRYGWPLLSFTDLNDLSRQLAEQAVEGFMVSGSFGLDGFVLAEAAEHRRPVRPAEFT